MSKEKYAVIDIGTNSARLLICHQDERGKLCRDLKTIRTTRMGQDVNKTGVLHPDAMERNETALAEFKAIMDEYQVADDYIFGTSAMRDASNTNVFLERIKTHLGLDVDVIDGEQEAAYGFIGAAQSFNEPILIFDIGGGSTELIAGKNGIMEKAVSLDMGCVRGTEAYLAHEIPEDKELAMLALDFDCRVRSALSQFGDLSERRLVGIGGTATTVAAMHLALADYDGEKIHGQKLSKDQLDHLMNKLRKLPLEERKQVPGLDAKRADVIVAGCVILDRILTALKADQFTVCDYDNLEGAAYVRFMKQV